MDSPNHANTLRVAIKDRVYAKKATGVVAWNGAGWEPSSYEGPWAGPLVATDELAVTSGLEVTSGFASYAVSTSQRAVAVLYPNHVVWRRWSDFSKDASLTGRFVRVVKVARDDVLHARLGPLPHAPLVEDLKPDARCLLEWSATSNLTRGRWRLVQVGDEKTAWVNEAFLAVEAAGACPAASR